MKPRSTPTEAVPRDGAFGFDGPLLPHRDWARRVGRTGDRVAGGRLRQHGRLPELPRAGRSFHLGGPGPLARRPPAGRAVGSAAGGARLTAALPGDRPIVAPVDRPGRAPGPEGPRAAQSRDLRDPPRADLDRGRMASESRFRDGGPPPGGGAARGSDRGTAHGTPAGFAAVLPCPRLRPLSAGPHPGADLVQSDRLREPRPGRSTLLEGKGTARGAPSDPLRERKRPRLGAGGGRERVRADGLVAADYRSRPKPSWFS